MTPEGRRVLRLCPVVFTLIALTGCTRLPPASQLPAGASGVAETTSIEAIVQPLRKSSDLATCRTVLQQINALRAAEPIAMTQRLDEKDAAFLRKKLSFSEEELNEIGSSSFTLLDAHHLEQCFAFHDAARSLEVDDAPAEVRAARAFAWVMRQVQLTDTKEPLVPPLPVLRRGWGTAEDRGLVFLTLLEQLDVPGCVIDFPNKAGLWLAAALVGKDVLLFDARVGFPIPGGDGRGMATLDQLRRQPEVILPRTALADEVRPDQARGARPQLICSLSALAPRMRFLEGSLRPACRVRLSCDAPGLHHAFKELLAGPASDGMTVDFLSRPGDPNGPVQVLRSFLPSEEGGSDETRWQQRQWQLTLTPWKDALPPAVRQVPENIEPGIRLRNAFEQPFLELVQTSGQPRDLLIRGRLADCVTRLVEVREGIDRHLDNLRAGPELDKELAAWCAEAERLHGDLLLARRQAATKNPANLAALEQTERQVADHWNKWDRIRQVVFSAAAVPLLREIDYFLALAKHEQAERAQARLERSAGKPEELSTTARDAWQSAAERWQRYLDGPVPSWPTAGALLNRARAMEMLGQRDAALALLESAAGNQRGWNEKTLRYAIQQLKAR